MAKILHILNDEKFVDGIICNYEAVAPKQSAYLVIKHNKNQKLKFVKSYDKITSIYYKDLISHIEGHKNKAIIIIHGLDRIKLRIIPRLHEDLRIVVHFWGSDIYLLPKFRGKLLKPETKRIFKKLTSPLAIIKDNYRGFYYRFYYNKYLSKVSMFSTVIPNESRFVTGFMPEAQIIEYNYVDIESLKLEQYRLSVDANDILIGNSSSFACNHIETIEAISAFSALDKVKKVIPLNYGNKKYADEIIEYIKLSNHKNFYPITEFLHLNKYLEVLSNCSVALMYHQRQQAVGNILICLWMGMKVFLSEANPAYNYFQDKGIVVFSFEKDLQHLEKSILFPLSKEQISNNRAVLRSIYSRKNTYTQIDRIINVINGQP